MLGLVSHGEMVDHLECMRVDDVHRIAAAVGDIDPFREIAHDRAEGPWTIGGVHIVRIEQWRHPRQCVAGLGMKARHQGNDWKPHGYAKPLEVKPGRQHVINCTWVGFRSYVLVVRCTAHGRPMTGMVCSTTVTVTPKQPKELLPWNE